MIFFIFDTSEEKNKFVYLYETYGKTIFYTIRLFIADIYQIEDLSQEIYIIIGKNLDKIDINNFKKTQNYIITITRNYCKNFLRKHNKLKESSLEEYINLQSEFPEILEGIIKDEEIYFLSNEINKLDDIYKMILELKYINEFTDDEIADFLQIKKKTVQMRLYRAKIMLRKKMKE